MKISKTMLISWITLAVAALSLPELGALVPVTALPYIAALAGALVVLSRWLDQYFDAIGILGGLTLVAGLLSVPDLVAIIPPQAAQIVTLITSILNLITRANQASPSLKGLLVQPPR